MEKTVTRESYGLKDKLKEQFKLMLGKGGYQPYDFLWDDQYKEGGWDHLKGIGEVCHNSIVTGHIAYMKGKCAVLDVGCGEGVIASLMGEENYTHFTGVDFSEHAIKSASKLSSEKTDFYCADAREFEPERNYDVLVFSESLNCMDEPVRVIERFKKYLNKDGLIIVSLFKQGWVDGLIWKKIDRCGTLVHKAFSGTGRKTWTCRIYKV